MFDIWSLPIAFILGVITSWIFWRYLTMVKPRIRISPVVAKGFAREDSTKPVYRVKVINLGNRPVINISARCVIIKPVDAPYGGKILTTIKRLSFLFVEQIPMLGPKRAHKRKLVYGKPIDISPFFIFSMEADPETEVLMSQGCIMSFTLTVSDALSGTTTVQRVLYTRDMIKEGVFGIDLNFQIGEQILD